MSEIRTSIKQCRPGVVWVVDGCARDGRSSAAAGAREGVAASVADRGPAAGVLIVGRDVADPGVQSDAVVVGADRLELLASAAGSSIAASWGDSVFRCERKLSIGAWSVGTPGRPNWVAIACSAMNSRVEPEVIWAPSSETASRIGWSERGLAGSASPSTRAVAWSSTPSASSARVKRTATWVDVVSLQISWSIHLRLTRSRSRAPGSARRGRPRGHSPRPSSGDSSPTRATAPWCAALAAGGEAEHMQPGRGRRWRARPTRARGRSRGGQAFGASRLSRSSRRAARGSPRPLRASARARGCRRRVGRRGFRPRGGRPSAAPGARRARAPGRRADGSSPQRSRGRSARAAPAFPPR